MPWGAAIAAGGAIIGGALSSSGAGKQAGAAEDAIQAQLQMFNQVRSDLGPFRDVGANAALQLGDLADLKGNPLTSALLSPITMDQATLEKTPGYQFTRTQGLKAVQNSAAARGLGLSGAALKGASAYATGLADSTYQNQFNNALTNRNLALNGLMGIANLGENAAAQTASNATATGQGVAGSTIAGGNAQAAGLAGFGNSIMGGANNAGGMFQLNSLINRLQGGGAAGGSMYGSNLPVPSGGNVFDSFLSSTPGAGPGGAT